MIAPTTANCLLYLEDVEQAIKVILKSKMYKDLLILNYSIVPQRYK